MLIRALTYLAVFLAGSFAGVVTTALCCAAGRREER